jgi:hypothetical protein
MSRIEERYRFVLRLLPASYRQRWEEDMVAAFLESVASEDPDETELIADYGRPSWSEVASVVALALRLRLGNAGAPPRYLAWAQAIRLAALVWLLGNAVGASTGVGVHLWLFGKVPWLSVPADDTILQLRADRWQTALVLSGLIWVPAYLALLLADLRVAKVLVLIAVGTDAIVLTANAVRSNQFDAMSAANLVIMALQVLALAAFHRDSPPVAPRPWLVALPFGIAVEVGLAVLTRPTEPTDGLWWFDWPALYSVLIVGASIVHMGLGRFRRAPSWSHALALVAVVVLALRLVSLLDYRQLDFVEGYTAMMTLSLVEAGTLLAVGVPLALLAARALRNLPPEPANVAAWSSRSDRSLN